MPNRLAHEDSPYLQQHAGNPVDWWPWCDEAFEKAIRENKPIFLSIGYSSCHWCHVMEREVFEDETIAAYLNAHFVSIKVDREERPDIDKYYQSVHQLLNQRPGGWPLSIFMTPDKKPFFAGTYIPPKRKYNMMGFLELIEVIHKKWTESPQDIVKNAEEIQRYLTPGGGPVKATKLEENLADRFLAQAADSYDARYGGFSPAPKFPHTSTIELLLDLHRLKKSDDALSMATHTLKNMAKGGLYDLVDGGFCRYSTDDRWLVPHFEKMTYDNALLIQTYLKAWHATKESFYLDIAEETIAFMQEKMMEVNLFYSASDADTEGEEGKYFVYGYDEVMEALVDNGFSKQEAAEICRALSITPEGNFEGKNIVRNESLATYPWWPRVRQILRAIRAARPYPFIDKKIITSWNAMMVKALFMAADIDDRHLKDAVDAMDALLAMMLKDDTLYHSALIRKTPTIEGFLEDYAYLCDALLAAYAATFDEIWLLKAQKLAEKAVALFYEGGKWTFSRGEFPVEADISDTSYPASAAVMCDALLTLGSLLDPEYAHIAFKTMEYYSLKIARYPIYHPTFTKAALRYLKQDTVVKSLPNRLADVKPLLDDLPNPFILLKAEMTPDYMTCNRTSCFANAKTLDALREALS
ncbi:thioredoxin domain-containing protein [Hydrogenimonas sp. SS33]|uniref:thioredoxin domain-containing protein n=1 Tax=Hydrogenimonas leucolamina TaxID=2954236 RepID=UPI00336C16A8